MLIGYARVSKSDGTQNLDLQRDALIAAGIDPQRVYEDYASGRKDARPGLDACSKAMRKGDTFVVWKLDRVGRDLKHLIHFIDGLRANGIGFLVLTGQGAQIDTTTSNGRMIFGIFAVLAEFERELIVERTKAGLAAARARGRKGGRPRKMDKPTLQMAMAALSSSQDQVKTIAKRLGITTTTLYEYLNGDGTPKALGHKVLIGY